ncbi:MAG TPA: hypothetical protein VGM90_08945 [Kofleriaceae bacterium]|jgi:hypothetical protein
MRRSLLLLLVACGHPAAKVDAPTNTAADTNGAAPSVDESKLGGLVLVPSVGENAITYTPHADAFAFDTNKAVTAGAKRTLVGMGGERTTVVAEQASALPYGCDNNSLEGTPLSPVDNKARLPAGVAWMLPADSTWTVSPLKIERGAHAAKFELYRLGPLALDLRRTQPSEGTATIQSRGASLVVETFKRELMDGAEPALATIDFSDPDMRLQIPVPVAGWALSANGPYLVVLHTQGFEGASLETFLVDVRPDHQRVAKIESMAVYLYQCAF